MFMFVFNENEQDIQFITVGYCSVPLRSFIIYINGIFLIEWDDNEW